MTARRLVARVARAAWLNGWTVLHARRAEYHQRKVSDHRHAVTVLACRAAGRDHQPDAGLIVVASGRRPTRPPADLVVYSRRAEAIRAQAERP